MEIKINVLIQTRLSHPHIWLMRATNNMSEVSAKKKGTHKFQSL